MGMSRCRSEILTFLRALQVIGRVEEVQKRECSSGFSFFVRTLPWGNEYTLHSVLRGEIMLSDQRTSASSTARIGGLIIDVK
eukprot:CCRYP_004204-RB/>CCRYP_004204-RB protein AED:0.02 eAED:0.02 QI:1492/0/0.33/1/0/0/3/2759/81